MSRTSTRRHIADLTTLNALAQTLNQSLDLRSALEGALAHIIELMGLRSGWIFLQGDAGEFALAARHDLPPALGYPGPAWAGACHCQELCLASRLDKAVNLVRCSRLRSAVGDKWGLAQHASVPLRSGDDILGILNVATTEWGQFSKPDLQLLSAAGSMLGTAIARAQLYEQATIRRVQEQRALLSLSEELLAASELEPALQRLVRVGARLLEVDACAFIEADELAGRAVLRAAHGWKLPESCAWPLTLDPETAHLWYLPENATDLAAEALADLPVLLKEQHFRGHLAIFVELGGVPIGTLMVNTRSNRQFLEDEVQLLGLLANQLAQTLERERLSQEALARQRLEQELDLARDIQESFLPGACPKIPGYAIAAHYQAARQVGGDFYDFIELPVEHATMEANLAHRVNAHIAESGAQVAPACATELPGQASAWETGTPAPSRLGIVIADVTDKGVPAALFMVLARTLLRATASDGRPPAAVFEQANRLILADSRSGLFVTCFYAQLDMIRGVLTYANGGHNYPLLYRVATGKVETLRAQGIVLGILPKPYFEQRSLTLQPGDILLLYTDGVTEAMNPERELFGEERLIAALRQHHTGGPQQIIEGIRAAVRAFVNGQSQSDDITIVVVQRMR